MYEINQYYLKTDIVPLFNSFFAGWPSAFGNCVVVDWPSFAALAGTVAVAALWLLGAAVVVVAGTPAVGLKSPTKREKVNFLKEDQRIIG